jgi:hypothetical protein
MNAQPNITGLFPSAAMESPTMYELRPILIEGELRIRDIDLGTRLGFANPIDIRKLIRRHLPALEAIGTVATVAMVIRGQ